MWIVHYNKIFKHHTSHEICYKKNSTQLCIALIPTANTACAKTANYLTNIISKPLQLTCCTALIYIYMCAPRSAHAPYIFNPQCAWLCSAAMPLVILLPRYCSNCQLKWPNNLRLLLQSPQVMRTHWSRRQTPRKQIRSAKWTTKFPSSSTTIGSSSAPTNFTMPRTTSAPKPTITKVCPWEPRRIPAKTAIAGQIKPTAPNPTWTGVLKKIHNHIYIYAHIHIPLP